MSLANHVSLTITTDSLGVARAGFGTILILSYNASFPELIRFYNDLSDVVADFATDSPEYRSAAAIFSQTPHPVQIAIGRGESTAPTQIYTISVNSVVNDHVYSLTVAGEGFAKETVTYTADATATDGEIVIGLVAALNLVTGKNFTAAGATSPFTITGDAAGNWFSVEGDPAYLDIAQTHADPGVAADLAAIKLENDSWYALHTFYNSDALMLAATSWIETEKKIYVVDTNDTDSVLTAAGNGDYLDAIATATRDRSAGIYHHAPDEMVAAAWMGRVLSTEPGTPTWKFKTLSGVTPSTLTATYRTNLVARNANFYEQVAGVNMMAEGTVGDGGFIDNQRSIDWLDDDMAKSVFETLAGVEKVPYTDDGVALVEGAMRGSLQRAVQRGVLAGDPDFVIEVPVVGDVSAANKTARLLPDVKFSGTLAGAVHKVNLTGVLSL